MEEEKYKKLLNILSNINENELDEYEQIKLLFKRFIFLGNEIIEKNNIWFERDEIKKDSEYYNVINLMIDKFLNNCVNKEAFHVEVLSKEINNIIQNSNFSSYYNNMYGISEKLDLIIDNYTEIVCGLLCLGYKKESEINSTFIASLKEFFQDERIQNSKYKSLFEEIDNDNIDETFMINLNSLIGLILEKGEEENIKFVIKKLKKTEDSIDQRISSVSTSIDNIEIEENKLNCYKNKKGQNSSSPTYQQSLPISQKPSPIIQNSSLSENGRKILTTEKNICKTNEKSSSAEESQVKEDKNNNKSIITTDIQLEKFETNDQNSKQQKNQTFTKSPIIQKLVEFYEPKENEENKIEKNDLNDSFEFIKKRRQKPEEKKEKKVKKEEENELKKTVMESVLTVFQRFMKYNNLLQEYSNFRNILKNEQLIESFKKEINEDKIRIEKLYIKLNEQKAIIKSLLPANIVNVKRKILDLIIFSILKQNKNSFLLDKEYCPKQNFLQKLSKKLENCAKIDNIPKSQKNKINEKIKFIEEEKSKKNSSNKFPYSCTDKKLDNIIKFLSIYKNEFNDIVHISKGAWKYYILPLKDGGNKKMQDLFNVFMKENQNNLQENYSVPNNKEKDDSSFNKDIKLDINIAFDILLKDKIRSDTAISDIEEKLEEIDVKKNEYLAKYSDSKINGCNMLLDECEICISKAYDDMIIFTEEDKTLIEDSVNPFKNSLKELKPILLLLNEQENKEKKNELVERFFKQFKKIVDKELKFNPKKYSVLCETSDNLDGRNATILFQIKVKKYEAANLFLKEAFKILNEYYDKEKNEIIVLLNELKKQTKDLITEIEKLTQIKSAKMIYRRWKYNSVTFVNEDFDSFVNTIKSYTTSVDIKLNDDLISDNVNSLWIIKNELTEFVD